MGRQGTRWAQNLVRRSNVRLAGLSVLAALSPYTAAMAQSVQPLPPTRSDLEPVPAPKALPRPRFSVEGGIERSPCALDDPAFADIKVRLNTATFNNLGPVPAEELADTYSRYVGTDQPISVLCAIRDAAATKLRAMGYVAAVQVPVQRIENGAVTFEVLYARVSSIRVIGKAGRNEALVAAYLQRLTDGQLFNRFEAERYLLLARDIPGLDVRLALKPAGTGAGEMVGEINIRSTPVTLDFNVQNLAAPSIGRFGGQLRGVFNGLTGMGDSTVVSAYSTGDFNEQQIYQFGHEMRIGGQGLRLGGRLTYAVTRPDIGPTVPDVSARTVYANLETGYPVVLKQAFALRAAAGIDVVDQKVRFAGLPLSEDRLRVGYLRFDIDAIDLKGVGPNGAIGWKLAASLEARSGLSLFDPSPNCLKSPLACGGGATAPSLPDGDPRARVLRASAGLEVRPFRRVTFAFSARGQTSSAPVFAFEQFSTGNYTVGRGFDPGVVVGDKGLGFQLEARRDPVRLSPKSRFDIQPYGFIDHALVWDRNSPLPNPLKVTSAGGGLRIGWGQARLDVAAGVPLNRLAGETARRDPRVLVTYSMNILPWRSR